MGLYSIQAAAQISGISDACIRVWEKRYNSITPTRNSSNHRLYSDSDIERLKLFNKLTSIGMRISQLSVLETDELRKIYLSVSQENSSDQELRSNRSSATFFQSLYIIEESFNAKRFDVAYHELKKVIDLSDVKDLALKFFPALEGICQSWKDKKIIDLDEVQAFERFSSNLASKKAHRERHSQQGLKSISVSIGPNKNIIADAGLEMLLASHRVEDCLFSNEPKSDFLVPMVTVVNPRFIFVIAEHGNPEVLKLIERISEVSKAKIIVFDQKLSLIRAKKNYDLKNATFFNSIFEIDRFIENSLQA